MKNHRRLIDFDDAQFSPGQNQLQKSVAGFKFGYFDKKVILTVVINDAPAFNSAKPAQ